MAERENLLLSKEVAHILGCSPADVIDVVQQGQLPAVKCGKFYRFNLDDVMVFKRRKEKANNPISKIA